MTALRIPIKMVICDLLSPAKVLTNTCSSLAVRGVKPDGLAVGFADCHG